jgi:hypothetical protein
MSKGEIIFCVIAAMIVVFLLMREYIKDDFKAVFAVLLEKQADAAYLAEAKSQAEKAKQLAIDQARDRSREIKGFGFGLSTP